jgi:hypothetical protein
VRDLRSPQEEVNKRWSQMLHMLNQQGGPGLYAETNALVDRTQARTSMKEAGGITMLNVGGLGMIKERATPQFPDAPARMHEAAIKLIDLISNIHTDSLTEPRGIPEAAATAGLKHRQGQLSQRMDLRAFRRYQRQKVEKVIAVAVGLMSDTQLTELLANHQKMVVKTQTVIDLETGEQASLESLREIKANVRMKNADTNNVERMLELGVFFQAMQLGVPVDPALVYERFPVSAEERQRLMAYAATVAQSQAQQAQSEIVSSQQALERAFQLEILDRQLKGAEISEQRRHNIANEVVAAIKAGANIQDALNKIRLQVQGQEREAILRVMEMIAKLSEPKQQPASEATLQ